MSRQSTFVSLPELSQPGTRAKPTPSVSRPTDAAFSMTEPTARRREVVASNRPLWWTSRMESAAPRRTPSRSEHRVVGGLLRQHLVEQPLHLLLGGALGQVVNGLGHRTDPFA